MNETEKRRPSPTDSLANERTFLAWIRTGIAIIAFGFVAVKFSLFINQIALLAEGALPLPDAGYSYFIGIALIIVGMIMSVLAYLRFRQVENQLTEGVYQSGFLLTLLLTICIIFVGVLMLIYLI